MVSRCAGGCLDSEQSMERRLEEEDGPQPGALDLEGFRILLHERKLLFGFELEMRKPCLSLDLVFSVEAKL